MLSMVYGVDIGSANVRIARMDRHGAPELIPITEDGVEELPAAVFFGENDCVCYGWAAIEEGIMCPERLRQYFRNRLGQEKDTRRDHQRADGQEDDPVALTAMVLEKALQCACYNGEHVKDVVLTCPVSFTDAQRDALRLAAAAAGLNVMGVVLEPAAAALGYGTYSKEPMQTILVYDLGGTNFDATLMAVDRSTTKWSIDVLGSVSDDGLGGCDWDNELYQLLLAEYETQYGTAQEDMDPDLKALIRGEAEGMKIKLTNRERVSTRIPFYDELIRLEVTREEFEKATAGYVTRTMDLLDSMLQKAGMTDNDVDVVLMVGGATRMPMICSRLTERFGDKACILSPRWTIVHGAAIAADMLEKHQEVQVTYQDGGVQLHAAERKLREQVAAGKAKLVYDRSTGKVRVAYADDLRENPEVARITDKINNLVCNAYRNHLLIDEVRSDMAGLFTETKRARLLIDELQKMIEHKTRIDELLTAMDPWTYVITRQESHDDIVF